jgi:hypothetical protein
MATGVDTTWQNEDDRTPQEQRQDPPQEAVEPGKINPFHQLYICMWKEVVVA